MSGRDAEREALEWLKEHDPDYDWSTHEHDGNLVGAVLDNLKSFGFEDAGLDGKPDLLRALIMGA